MQIYSSLSLRVPFHVAADFLGYLEVALFVEAFQIDIAPLVYFSSGPFLLFAKRAVSRRMSEYQSVCRVRAGQEPPCLARVSLSLAVPGHLFCDVRDGGRVVWSR